MEVVKITNMQDISLSEDVLDKVLVLDFDTISKYYFVDDKTTSEIVYEKYGVKVDSKWVYDGNILYFDDLKYITHIVKPYETLFDIAKKYNADEMNIIKRNSLTTTKLYVGQRIIV